jgi:CBS domain-containing protein
VTATGAIMSRDVLAVEPDIGLQETAERMVARSVGAVLVLEEGRLAGILTERDVLKAVAAGRAERAVVRDWMTADPEVIGPDEPTDQAATLMIHGGFRHLPVVEAGELVGIVSVRDLIRVTLADSSPRGA